MTLRKIINPWLALSAFTLLSYSCTEKVERAADIPTITLEETDERIPQQLIDSIFTFDKFVIPQLTEESTLDVINKVVLANNTIFILHGKNTITSFDINGEFIGNYSHIGTGPGEYVSINDFDIKGDTLFILSRDNIYLYSMDDKFIKKIQLTNAAKGLKVLNSGVALNNGFGLGSKKTQSSCSYTYISDRDTLNRIEFNHQLLGNSFSHNGLCSSFVSDNSNSGVLTYYPYNDTIYSVNVSDGEINPLIAIKIGERNINKDTPDDEVMAIRSSDAVNVIYAPYNWGKYLMFSYLQGAPKTAIVSTSGEVIMNGTTGVDSNGIPISFIDMQSDISDKQALSLLSPMTLNAIVSHKENLSEHPVLQLLAEKVSQESNPILVFYNVNIQ